MIKEYIGEIKQETIVQLRGEIDQSRDKGKENVTNLHKIMSKLNDETLNTINKIDKKMENKFLQQEQISDGYKDNI